MVRPMSLVFPVVAVLFAAAPLPPNAVPANAANAVPANAIAIIEVDAPDTMMGLAGQVTRALVAEAQAQKLPIVTPEDLRARLAPKAWGELKKCGGRVACIAQTLDGQGISRAVLGQLGRDEKNYLLKLWLVDVRGMTVIADVDRAILIAARRFQKDLDEALPRLLRGEREAHGTLVIEANLADAQISLNGEFLGTPPLTQTLKPGKYEVKLERRKYLSITRLLNVDADKETREHFNLLLKPGEVADDQVPTLVKKPGEAPPAQPLRLSAPTWICGALTLLGGGASLYFSLTERDQEQKLLAGFDQASGVYAGTRKDALAAQQSALLANVSYGVTGAALAATILFLVLDATSPVQVAPAVAGGGGGVVLRGHF
jgi:hypothetical protein